MVAVDIRESKTRREFPFLDQMAAWLVLLLPWSVLAALDNGEISEKATNSGDIMNAIINQVVISMQREMEGEQNSNYSQKKEELRQQEGQHHRCHDATADEKGTYEKCKKSVSDRKERDAVNSENENNNDVQQGSGREGEVRQGRSMDQQYNFMKSFWKWERTLNSRPKLSNIAWFVLDNNEETAEDNKRKIHKRGSVAKSFQR